MKLFTKDINEKLFKQYPLGSDLSKQKAIAKIFNPYGRGRWFLLNSDPSDPNYLWAIVEMDGNVEIGSVSRNELESIRLTNFRLPLERDLGFRPINAEELYKGLLQGKFYAKGGYMSNGGNTDEKYEYEIEFDKDDGKILVEVTVKQDGEMVYNLTGQLIKYGTGRAIELEFQPDWFSDQNTEDFYSKNWENFEDRITEKYYSKKRKYFDGGYFANGGQINRELNLFARSEAEKSGITQKQMGLDYFTSIAQALVSGLTDSNFHAEAKEVVSMLENKEWTNDMYKSIYYSPNDVVDELGIKVAQKAQWNGYEVAMAFKYLAQMSGNQKLAKIIDKVFDDETMEQGGKIDHYKKFELNADGNFEATISGNKYLIKYRDDRTKLYDLYKDGSKVKSSINLRKLMSFSAGGFMAKGGKIKIKSYKEYKEALTNIANQTNSKEEFVDKVKSSLQEYIPRYFGDVRRDIFKVSDSEWIVMLQSPASYSRKLEKVSLENLYYKLKTKGVKMSGSYIKGFGRNYYTEFYTKKNSKESGGYMEEGGETRIKIKYIPQLNIYESDVFNSISLSVPLPKPNQNFSNPVGKVEQDYDENKSRYIKNSFTATKYDYSKKKNVNGRIKYFEEEKIGTFKSRDEAKNALLEEYFDLSNLPKDVIMAKGGKVNENDMYVVYFEQTIFGQNTPVITYASKSKKLAEERLKEQPNYNIYSKNKYKVGLASEMPVYSNFQYLNKPTKELKKAKEIIHEEKNVMDFFKGKDASFKNKFSYVKPIGYRWNNDYKLVKEMELGGYMAEGGMKLNIKKIENKFTIPEYEFEKVKIAYQKTGNYTNPSIQEEGQREINEFRNKYPTKYDEVLIYLQKEFNNPNNYEGYMAGGGQVDLFEHYDKQPLKVREVLEKYEMEEGDYDSLEKLKSELNEVGYTFDYGLDYQPYGLRPIGVPLNELEGYEDYESDGYMAEGGISKKLYAVEIYLEGEDEISERKKRRNPDLRTFRVEVFQTEKAAKDFYKKTKSVGKFEGLNIKSIEYVGVYDENKYWAEAGGYMAGGGSLKAKTYKLYPMVSTGVGNLITPDYKSIVTFTGTEDEAVAEAKKLANSNPKFIRVEVKIPLKTKTITVGIVEPSGGIMAKGGKVAKEVNQYVPKTKELGVFMKKGGKVKFSDKVKSIQKSLLKRKKVPKAVQKDYGKEFSKAEALESARRIAGAMRKKELSKKKP